MNEFTGVSMDGFQPVKRTLILGNGGPGWMYTCYAGNSYDVPPKHMMGRKPGKTIDGTPIPGTILLESAYRFNDPTEVHDDGSTDIQTYEIQPDEILKQLLGFDPKTATATSDFARRGLTWIPNGSTMEKAEEILAAAAERWKVADLEDARKMVEVQLIKMEKAKANGTSAPVPKGYRNVEAKVRAADAQLEAQYRTAAPGGEMTDDLEFEANLRLKLMDVIQKRPGAETLSLDAKKQQLEALMADKSLVADARRSGWLIKKVAPTNSEMRKLGKEAKEWAEAEPVAIPMDLENAS